MSSIVIKGDTSGQIEIAAPAVAGSTTLTLPTGNGTVLLSDGDGSSLTNLPAIGIGQTWQIVTGSRAASITYTNTTGKPIAISIRAETTATAVADALFVVGGVNAWSRYCGSINPARFSIMAIVPTGATYYLSIPTGTVFDTWAELR